MHSLRLKVDQQDRGMRLDLWLLKKAQENKIFFSRSGIKKLITAGKVSLKGINPKAHYKIKSGDCFTVLMERQEQDDGLEPQAIPLDIIYQDQDLAVINKPCGLVVHPGAGNLRNTLVNALIYHFDKLSKINPQRPGIVHRLDKDTSGLLLVAKSDRAHLDLAQQFSKHTIKRSYLALVRGHMEFDENIIELPITRHVKDRKKMSVGFNPRAKYAKTRYRTLIRTRPFSLVELIPFTGRTHQLRVHLAHIGHPILGDSKYGRDNRFFRLALQANQIGFRHPGLNRYMEFSIPIPESFLDKFPPELKNSFLRTYKIK